MNIPDYDFFQVGIHFKVLIFINENFMVKKQKEEDY